jgi:coproporphyrinogen III oxidase-like Fe-S oxidoreductase
MSRTQNICDYRAYADRALAGESAVVTNEVLTPGAKRAERIALMLRTNQGIPYNLVEMHRDKTEELTRLGLLVESDGNLLLTRAGKSLADTVAEALI